MNNIKTDRRNINQVKQINLIVLLTLLILVLMVVSLFIFNSKINSVSEQLETIKKEQKLSNTPIVSIEGSFITRNQEFGIILRNKGQGSGFIKSINAKFKDKWYKNLCDENNIVKLLKAMGVDGLWAEYYCYKTGEIYNDQISMVAGEKKFLIRAVKGLYSDENYLRNCKKLGLSINKLLLEIEYCSKDGECKWVRRDFSKEDIFLDSLPD
ncbi:hypothetical protein [Tenacibaculum sp. 190524A05c]|uniref:hypothetical protein n=1 Tax=Tenacibaculum platacis TaxID=3137852 RepID=UPI0032B1CBCA